MFTRSHHLPRSKSRRRSYRPLPNYLEETATTEAVAKVEIRARVQGFLESVHFEPGSDVKEGDLLYEIEPELYQARVESAEADLLAQKARAKKAKLEKERRRICVLKTSGPLRRQPSSRHRPNSKALKRRSSRPSAAQTGPNRSCDTPGLLLPSQGRVGKSLRQAGQPGWR